MKLSRQASVIILTKNRPDQLAKCLNSLSRQTTRPSEVVVVDSSDQKPRSFSKNYGFSLVYRYAPQCSIPGARQMGLDITKHFLVLYLDDDCTAERNWLKKMIELSVVHPHATLIAGSLIHVPVTSIYAQIISDTRTQRIHNAGPYRYLYFNIENCLIRKEFIKKHNIKFDEALFHEDFADFALQVKKSDGEIVISDESKVYHHERRSLLSFLRQRFKNSGNLIRLKKKWPAQEFHFFASHRSSFLNVLIKRVGVFVKKGETENCLKYIGIIILSVVTYELGNLHTKISNHEGLNRGYLKVRPIIDFLLAVLLIVPSIPVMMIIGAIIKLDSPGPIIFSQLRVGKNFKLFRFYKFRTMWRDSRQRFPDLYNYKLSPKDTLTYRFKIPDDARLTRFGRYLRKTSLDELPNLINVLKGDMGLVGPRPEIPEMLPYYEEEEKAKFTIRPGITGYAQVMGRGLLTFKQTIKYDNQYISRQGALFDMQIVIWTICVVIRGLGAF